jgi:hypothetical protein
MRAHIYGLTNSVMLPQFKDVEWARHCRWLGKAVEIVDVGADVSDQGQAKTWVQGYLGDHPPERHDGGRRITTAPYVDGTAVVLWAPEFRKWLMTAIPDKIGIREMSVGLRQLGAHPGTATVWMRDHAVQRACWRVPLASLHLDATVPATTVEDVLLWTV